MTETIVKPLQDRVVLITGAAGCLGRVAAKSCATRGAAVVLLDKDVPGLECVYDDIMASGGPKPAIYPFDLAGANEQDYLELSDVIEQKYDKLHGLLHNAAVLGSLSPITHCSTASWSRIMHVNLNAPYLLTRVLLPVLGKADDAAIVFTSDSVARSGRAFWGAYGVSKIAGEGLAHILADELESKGTIRVNIMIPGAVNSPIREQAYPAENGAQRTPPEALDTLYAFLLGPASIAHTGQVFEAQEFNKLRE